MQSVFAGSLDGAVFGRECPLACATVWQPGLGCLKLVYLLAHCCCCCSRRAACISRSALPPPSHWKGSCLACLCPHSPPPPGFSADLEATIQQQHLAPTNHSPSRPFPNIAPCRTPHPPTPHPAAEAEKPPPTSRTKPQRVQLDEGAVQSELLQLGLPHAAAALDTLRTTLNEGGWVGGGVWRHRVRWGWQVERAGGGVGWGGKCMHACDCDLAGYSLLAAHACVEGCVWQWQRMCVGMGVAVAASHVKLSQGGCLAPVEGWRGSLCDATALVVGAHQQPEICYSGCIVPLEHFYYLPNCALCPCPGTVAGKGTSSALQAWRSRRGALLDITSLPDVDPLTQKVGGST